MFGSKKGIRRPEKSIQENAREDEYKPKQEGTREEKTKTREANTRKDKARGDTTRGDRRGQAISCPEPALLPFHKLIKSLSESTKAAATSHVAS